MNFILSPEMLISSIGSKNGFNKGAIYKFNNGERNDSVSDNSGNEDERSVELDEKRVHYCKWEMNYEENRNNKSNKSNKNGRNGNKNSKNGDGNEKMIHCNKAFNNTNDLTNHIIQEHVGSGKSQYTCCWEECERNHRIFNQRQKIVRHLHVHTKHKPFVCSICQHRFSVDTMLQQHMRIHSGEKPFKCKICSKTFTTSSSLTIHLRIHSGEKPLVCKYPGCGKRFSESSNLTKHMRIHEKKYKCKKCCRSFDREEQLRGHLMRHEKKEAKELKIKTIGIGLNSN
ncbi:Zap1p ASCRUDRAFT_77822 [Ascoidea rubescens DSM 1968]|uniref:C2H2-type domain-containing protein n=1 Tax=Ascoidea rubescens DSM 1968 TaxID=1344418 RepID=A0A1D2VA93_9ASCO|nr:hypothetical protein ASCRUDRAFT_77822 [Ascoidea rubescens DSM 1968]ODV58578.1 hypothetical protein ASCRUDRAFT_77822 [Ascoidea rubescens DSM 1968]